jgi:cyanophycinase
MQRWAWLALVAALAGCGSAGGGGGAYHVSRLETPGTFVLIGGGDTSAFTYERFLHQAGGPGAPVVVVPFASGAADGEDARRGLTAQGADATVLTGDPARREAEATLIRQANGLYFVGGVAEKLTAAFQPYAEAARAAWQAGCVIGGTSAGAMVWGDRMIVRGDPGQVQAHGLDEAHGGAAVRPGLGWLAGLTVDPHFSERTRMYRLWLAAGETHTLGLGIDEGTMAILSPAGAMRVVGGGTVTVLRPEGAAGQPARMTILKQGDELRWKDWTVDAR